MQRLQLGSGLALFCLIGTSTLLAPTSAEADDSDDDGSCKKISAEIVSTPTTIDCASPIGLCTEGTIRGNHGLRGTTKFTALSAAPFPGEPPTTLAVTGALVITTRQGTLTTSDVFNFDTALGAFSSIERVTGGTGKFSGASGTLFIGGRVQTDGSFLNELSGDLCVPEHD
jgi:hypothetical protein